MQVNPSHSINRRAFEQLLMQDTYISTKMVMQEVQEHPDFTFKY